MLLFSALQNQHVVLYVSCRLNMTATLHKHSNDSSVVDMFKVVGKIVTVTAQGFPGNSCSFNENWFSL